MSIDLYVGTDFDNDLNVNMANGNAARIFGMLGVALDFEEFYGVLDARDLADRCQAFLLVEEAADHAVETVREGNYIDCGIDADYIVRRVRAILALAQHAQRVEQGVTYS